MVDLQVMEDRSGPPSPVQTLMGTPKYMAIDVLLGHSHSPSTHLESLCYTILADCAGASLSDGDAGLPWAHAWQ